MSGCGCGQSPIVIGGCRPTGAARLPVEVLCPGSTPCRHCETTPLRDSAAYRVAATADSTDPTPYYTIANTHAALDPVVARTILNGGTGTFPADDGTHNGQHTWLAGVVHIDPTSLCGDPTSLTISASVHVHNDGPDAACRLYGRFALWNGTTPIRTDLLGPPNLPAGGDDNGVIPPTTVSLADVLAGRVVVELNLETGNDDACRVGPKQWTVDSFVLTVQASAPGRGRSFLRTTCRNCDGVITCTADTLDGSTPYAPVPPVVPVASCQDGCSTTRPPCISTDLGNAITRGSDGCLYAPDTPALDPSPCNAARNTAGGLLVPGVELMGIAPGGNISLERSVDIDVTEMPGCPEGWRIGARLTPVSAFLNAERQHANLLAETGTDVPIPESDIVLPEAGVYHIDSDVRYALGTATGGSGYIIGWLRDETTDTLLTSFTQIAAINAAGQEHQGGTTHIMTEYTATSGPRTVRLHLMFVLSGGRITDAEAGGTDSNGATRMRFLKVRD
ncbi:hypothetical protein GCM10010433_57020 [Streptomyces pulveraceus]|uniref:Uncharacterized protein n=1 Tax=Streptomyces pulveraceus TaxID=68258 RepID=A0ABW1GTB3_9ACTN